MPRHLLLLFPALLGVPLHAQLSVPPHGAYQHHAFIQPMYDEFEHSTLVVITDLWTSRTNSSRFTTVSISPWLTFPGRVPPDDINAEKVELVVRFDARLPKGTSSDAAFGDPRPSQSLSLVIDHGYRIDLPFDRHDTGEKMGADSSTTVSETFSYRLSLPDWFALVHGSHVEGSAAGAAVLITDPAFFQALLDLASRMRE